MCLPLLFLFFATFNMYHNFSNCVRFYFAGKFYLGCLISGSYFPSLHIFDSAILTSSVWHDGLLIVIVICALVLAVLAFKIYICGLTHAVSFNNCHFS